MRTFTLFSLYFLLLGCTAPKTVPYTQYVSDDSVFQTGSALNLKITESESPEVRYRGDVDYNGTGIGSMNMLYPAGSPEVFIGAVLAHFFTAESIKNSQKQSLQDEADKVLNPYNEDIENFSNTALLETSLSKVKVRNLVHIDGTTTEWIMESTPVFFMSQDESTLRLNNFLKVYSESTKDEPIYTNLIEIVSLPFDRDSRDYWNQEVGGELKLFSVSSDLFADSIDIAIFDLENVMVNDDSQEQTIKYYLAGSEQYERGTLISESCQRLTIRTLRGWIKSVPVWPEDIAASNLKGCA